MRVLHLQSSVIIAIITCIRCVYFWFESSIHLFLEAKLNERLIKLSNLFIATCSPQEKK